MNTSGDLTATLTMDENVIHQKVSAADYGNSSCDILHLNNIKEEVLFAEPNAYADTSKDLLFETELKEGIKVEVFNEALSTHNGNSRCVVNGIKEEFSPTQTDTSVKQEINEDSSSSFQVKVEHIDIKLESPLHQEVDIKAEMQSDNADTTQCTENKSSHSSVQQHIKMHTGEKPFQCSMCNFKCSHSSNLKQHMMIHTGEKPFECSICNHKCARKSDLKKHKQIHTGEKPFQCNKCNYKCLRKSSLKGHMNIHTAQGPFRCTMCNYICSRNRNLKLHMYMHTRENPFQCNVCNFKFSNKFNLQNHMNIHSG